MLQVTSSAIGMYERGERFPQAETLLLIADIFDVSTDYLLGRELAPTACSPTPDPLFRQLLDHLSRMEQSMVELKADIQELKEIAQANSLLAERVNATETDIKLIKKAITKE